MISWQILASCSFAAWILAFLDFVPITVVTAGLPNRAPVDISSLRGAFCNRAIAAVVSSMSSDSESASTSSCDSAGKNPLFLIFPSESLTGSRAAPRISSLRVGFFFFNLSS